jgi:hypothetical protein
MENFKIEINFLSDIVIYNSQNIELYRLKRKIGFMNTKGEIYSNNKLLFSYKLNKFFCHVKFTTMYNF